jgi:CDP-4-dehydro-6-deoxyglucose reductase, E1
MIKLQKSTFLKEKQVKKNLCEFILNSKFLSMGEQCALFEKKFCKKQGRNFAVYVNSGSSANLALFQSLLNLGRLKKGDDVAVSALTWSTNIMPIIQLGLNPILLDCEISNLNISSKIFLNYLKKNKPKALFITNVLGFCSDINIIREICVQQGIIFLEDNCESLGSESFGKNLGNFGLASTFSFYVGHHLSTIEGGMISTDDEDLYNQLLMVRAHGWDRSLPKSSQIEKRKKHNIDNFYASFAFYDLAYNIRPTEINGFIGNTQLPFWDEVVIKRQRNFKYIQNAMLRNNNLINLDLDHMTLISNFSIPVILKEKKMFNSYVDIFREAGIEVRPIIAGNISNQPFFKKYLKLDQKLKNTELIHQNGFYFGNNSEISLSELKIVKDLL